MSLTILGAHGGDVWVETNGELFGISAVDLAAFRAEVASDESDGIVSVCLGLKLDESDVTALIQALNGPQLDDCHHCEQPGLIDIEGRTVCPGCANGYGLAEQESEGER